VTPNRLLKNLSSGLGGLKPFSYHWTYGGAEALPSQPAAIFQPRRGFQFLLRTIALALPVLFSAGPAVATIQYRVSLDHPERHELHVTISIPVRSEDVVVAMPAWNALYEVRDFAYRVRPMLVTSGSGSTVDPHPPESLDKQTWRLCRCASIDERPQAISFAYSVEWNVPGPFSSQLNEHHAFLNLAEVFMYVPGRRTETVEVRFENVPAGWKVMVELPSGPVPNSFTASNYDALVDAPVEAGDFHEFEFDSGGAHFRVVVDAKSFSRTRLEDYLRRIVTYETKLMRGLPFKEYTFVFHFGPRSEVGGGGMEHANSAAMSAASVDAPNLFAHEFFHVWNVKRIRPQTLEPVDYTKEQYSRALWFAEGVTSTYGAYTLVRTGLWSKDEFYDDLASQITELESRPARKTQSAEESSLDTWLEKYDEYDLPDRSISYYNKGQILGVLLDLAIRDATDNRKSLDDVMRRMNDEYAKQGRFYNDSQGIRAVVEEVAGINFADFFRRYVAGVDEIPFTTFLAAAGLELKPDDVNAVDLGFTPGHANGQGVPVGDVDSGSPAENAGLRAGDLILQRNGREPPHGRRGWVSDVRPGDTMSLQIMRDGQMLNISYVLAASEQASYSLGEMPHPTDKQRRIREGLLRGTTNE
jgi:predicted metalloprotease with PDZ domain